MKFLLLEFRIYFVSKVFLLSWWYRYRLGNSPTAQLPSSVCLAPGGSGFEMIIKVKKICFGLSLESTFFLGCCSGRGLAHRDSLEFLAVGICTPGEVHHAWTPVTHGNEVFLEAFTLTWRKPASYHTLISRVFSPLKYWWPVMIMNRFSNLECNHGKQKII